MSCHRIDARETERNLTAMRLAVVREELDRREALQVEERRLEAQLGDTHEGGEPRGGPIDMPRGLPVVPARLCREKWGAMTGDDRVRRCSRCKKRVYDLGGASREEAEQILASGGDPVPQRLFLREDGTVLTTDCPVGKPRKVSRAVAAVVAAAFALTTMVAALGTVVRARAEAVLGDHAVLARWEGAQGGRAAERVVTATLVARARQRALPPPTPPPVVPGPDVTPVDRGPDVTIIWRGSAISPGHGAIQVLVQGSVEVILDGRTIATSSVIREVRPGRHVLVTRDLADGSRQVRRLSVEEGQAIIVRARSSAGAGPIGCGPAILPASY